MAPAIEIKNLSVSLGSVRALKNVSLELPAGKIIGLIGPSGAGKTTLIRTIIGSQLPSSGTISVDGLVPGAKKLRGRIGYMPQSAAVYSDLTVLENLKYFGALVGAGHGEIESALAKVNMRKYKDRVVDNLSGGQKSRVSLAIALLGKPSLLVLDEPTVGIDPVLRRQLWDIFRELADSGATLLISSHVMDEASRCDSLLLIRGGRILAMGTPAGLCRDNGVKSVEEVFLKLVKKEQI
ncbi:MAG TPA: ABC transporter ATP-binding protein [Candidatus Saccharimonadales bacterium]|nr:ABC transporter ATP-binding protein [Candidatus Saccharimonadales bacterium]